MFSTCIEICLENLWPLSKRLGRQVLPMARDSKKRTLELSKAACLKAWAGRGFSFTNWNVTSFCILVFSAPVKQPWTLFKMQSCPADVNCPSATSQANTEKDTGLVHPFCELILERNIMFLVHRTERHFKGFCQRIDFLLEKPVMIQLNYQRQEIEDQWL